MFADKKKHTGSSLIPSDKEDYMLVEERNPEMKKRLIPFMTIAGIFMSFPFTVEAKLSYEDINAKALGETH